mmetsp:Transcript_6640/g.11582  ORF Transcript_6640/g.11582 Transcript_6640/m.11582 type:complete len:342 (-) Transcript_6640:61-1086(-)
MSDVYVLGDFSVLVRAGALSGLATTALLTPLDVLKHSAQACVASRQVAPSLPETFRAVVATGGYRALWRGITPACIGAALTPSISFLFYEMQTGEAFDRAVKARALATFFCQPFEFVRTIRQAQYQLPGRPKRNAPLPTEAVHVEHLARRGMQIVFSEGFTSFWRVLGPTVLRDCISTAAFLALFLRLESTCRPESDNGYEWEAPPPPPLQAAAISSFSAVVAAALTHPLDVVRVQCQTYNMVEHLRSGYVRHTKMHMIGAGKLIYSVAGWPGFTAGLAARCVRAALVGFALGPLFEYGLVVSRDSLRPKRAMLNLQDTDEIVVHPRQYDMHGGIRRGLSS